MTYAFSLQLALHHGMQKPHRSGCRCLSVLRLWIIVTGQVRETAGICIYVAPSLCLLLLLFPQRALESA